MNHSRHRLAVLIATAALLIPLPACANPSGHASHVTDNPAYTETAHEVSLADLRAHYDALLITLRAELAALRSDADLTREALISRIEALESVINSLGIDLSGETAVSPPADTQPEPNESAPSEGQTRPPTQETADSPLPTESLPPPESAEEPFRLAYTVESTGVVITGVHGPLPAHLNIPATLDGHPVTRIADNAFSGLPIEMVTLPASLAYIGWFAFAGCTELHTVTIPASVEHIDYGAFDGCPRLTIYCPTNSYAARYAAASAIPHVEV